MSEAKQQGARQKNRALLFIAMILVYILILLGTLYYTGVLKFPSNKKANVAGKKTDIKNKSRSPVKTVKAADNKTETVPTKLDTTTTTTLYSSRMPDPGQQTSHNTESDQDFKRLVKVYETMDSDQAAKIISALSDRDAVAVLSSMKTQNVAEILAAMNVQRAASLSKKLGIPAQ